MFYHWDGESWTPHVGAEIFHPDVGSYASEAVTISLDGEIWAAGGTLESSDFLFHKAGAFLERWDGNNWVEIDEQDGQTPTSLIAVADANEVWVVQEDPQVRPYPELRHWDGNLWTEPQPTIGTINGLVFRARGDAWAAGAFSEGLPLIAHWNGDLWGRIDVEAPAGLTGGLQALTVTPSGAVVAFGTDPLAVPAGDDDATPANPPKSYLWVNCG